jgi:multiple sugar transport system substrate-binding protein
MERRDFLRLAGAGASLAVAGCACGGRRDSEAGVERRPAGSRTGRPALRIIQGVHYVPAYDAWFDNEYTKRWGEQHDVDVVVDHLPLNELPIRADSEAAAKEGHDLFWFVNPRPSLEDDVVDHRDIIEEVIAKVGPMTNHIERSVHNPRTNRFFAFPDYWAPRPLHYRVDLWEQVQAGEDPSTWDIIRRAGVSLKARGYPVGFGMSAELDSDVTLNSLLNSYGGSVQDEAGNLVINRPATVEAVKVCTDVYRAGMTDEVFGWDSASNNRLLTSGRGSLILNAISALRAAEQQNPQLATQITLAPAPLGPAGDKPRCIHLTGSYVIWKFPRTSRWPRSSWSTCLCRIKTPFSTLGSTTCPPFRAPCPTFPPYSETTPASAHRTSTRSSPTPLAGPRISEARAA